MRFRQVHIDFHTSEKIPGVGIKFHKKQFQQALQTGHVDAITVFSKCHHGWAYHPTKANEMHPNLSFDLLKAQMKAAKEIGVKVSVYLSAGLDEKYAVRHPEWLMRTENGDTVFTKDFERPGYHRFCMNTPYLDYLLAQLKEVCETYDADGIFMDIVGVRPCYCETCRKTLELLGQSPDDLEASQALAERVYANYTRRVRETIDSVKPGLPVFHNGGHVRIGRRDLAFMNSHLELESLPTGGWGYDHFPLSARYAQGLGMEYLGMTGKFHTTWGEFGGFKHPNALRYEVSLAAANGAKSSIGDQLHPSGEMDMATYQLIGAAYEELEQKEPWLNDVTQVADVALFSSEAYYSHAGGAPSATQGHNAKTDAGASRILLEGKYLFDVIDAESDFNRYKVIILPDVVRVTPGIKEKLDAFLETGGKILACGKGGLLEERDAFAYDFGAVYGEENPYCPDYFRPDFSMEGLFPAGYLIYSQGEKIALKEGGAEHGKRENPYFNRTLAHFCSHKNTPNSLAYGGPGMTQGKDGMYIAWPVFSEYADKGALILKRMVTYALDTLLGNEKTLSTTLGAQGVTTLMKQENRYVHHLLYVSPVKRGQNIEVVEDIVPVYDTKVTLKLPNPIKRVYLAPQNQDIPFTQENGVVTYTVEKIDCHQMVVLDF